MGSVGRTVPELPGFCPLSQTGRPSAGFLHTSRPPQAEAESGAGRSGSQWGALSEGAIPSVMTRKPVSW